MKVGGDAPSTFFIMDSLFGFVFEAKSTLPNLTPINRELFEASNTSP